MQVVWVQEQEEKMCKEVVATAQVREDAGLGQGSRCDVAKKVGFWMYF